MTLPRTQQALPLFQDWGLAPPYGIPSQFVSTQTLDFQSLPPTDSTKGGGEAAWNGPSAPMSPISHLTLGHLCPKQNEPCT